MYSITKKKHRSSRSSDADRMRGLGRTSLFTCMIMYMSLEHGLSFKELNRFTVHISVYKDECKDH